MITLNQDYILKNIINNLKKGDPNLAWPPDLTGSDLLVSVPLIELSKLSGYLELLFYASNPMLLYSIITSDKEMINLENKCFISRRNLEDMIYDIAERKYYPLKPINNVKSSGLIRIVVREKTPSGNKKFRLEGIEFIGKNGLTYVPSPQFNFIDLSKGAYFIDDPVYNSKTYGYTIVSECATPGSIGNLDIDSIVGFDTDLSSLSIQEFLTHYDIIRVYNITPFSGGLDKEDLYSYVKRIASLYSSNFNMNNFLLELARSFGYKHIKVRSLGDPLFLRKNGFDVWVDEIIECEDLFYDYALTLSPEKNIYSFSVFDKDLMQLVANPSVPSSLKLNYYRLLNFQNTLRDLSMAVGSDDFILVRGMLPIYYKFALGVTIKPIHFVFYDVGTDYDRIKNEIISAVNNFFTSLEPGSRVDFSDIIYAVEKLPYVEGVISESVVFYFFWYDVSTQSGSPTQPREYMLEEGGSFEAKEWNVFVPSKYISPDLHIPDLHIYEG